MVSTTRSERWARWDAAEYSAATDTIVQSLRSAEERICVARPSASDVQHRIVLLRRGADARQSRRLLVAR